MSMSRRSWLSAVLGMAATRGLVRPAAGAPPDQAAVRQADELRPVSMAMHIHGSFSEGIASYEAHLQQARQHGVDVIWWTDHDFRVAAHHYRKAVRFEGFTELEGELEWSWNEEREGDVALGSAEFIDDPRSPDEPGRAMRLNGRSGSDTGCLWYRAKAWNSTYSVSMADTTIELDVLADETGPGRELALEIHSSYHPARNGRPAGQYVLQYRIGGSTGASHRPDGLHGIVEVPTPRGQWHRLRLRPVSDIQKIWPDLVAEDNSLHQLRIGIRLRSDADTRAIVDRLRFGRGRAEGESGIDVRRAVLARYRDEYPDVAHYEAFEVSLVRHLNWFGGTLTLPPLASPPYRNNDPDLAEQMIAFMHSHGALAQWNHPLDVEKPESLVRLMIERRNLGADIVEIGRPPFDQLRQVFDAAARNAIFFTAVGVSDDHAGRDWLGQPSNMLTYVWARSTARDDLIAALSAGRAWWADAAKWRGALNLEIDGRAAMGSVLVMLADKVHVGITATEIPAGGTLEILESPVDYAGPEDAGPAARSHPVPASRLLGDPYMYLVELGKGAYVRLQVRDRSGDVVGESNPLWLLREPPAHGIPDARQLEHR
jgi:hypothetical protein